MTRRDSPGSPNWKPDRAGPKVPPETETGDGDAGKEGKGRTGCGGPPKSL